VNGTQAATTATDGNANTYWESNNNAFPQWLQVDLGAAYAVGKVTLKLPPATAWATRTQTLSVQASTDGTTFSTAVGSATYTFNPASGNTADVTVPGTNARYLRVNVTANSGWPAGQVSEFEVYPSGGTSPAPGLAANPTSLTYGSQALNTTSAGQTVSITNSGTAAATSLAVAVTGDYAQANTCGTSLAAGASCAVTVTFRPTASGTRPGTLTVSGGGTSTSVALTGTGAGTTNTNLAAGRPSSESSHHDIYAPGNVTDADQSTYWESVNNAFPQWVQVDLGSAQSASRVVLQLPAPWGARTETLSLLASGDGSNWTTVEESAGYVFTPSANNTVTITFTATTQRYFRLNITANTGWPAAQISGFQVWNN
jgi:hypothetical protein